MSSEVKIILFILLGIGLITWGAGEEVHWTILLGIIVIFIAGTLTGIKTAESRRHND